VKGRKGGKLIVETIGYSTFEAIPISIYCYENETRNSWDANVPHMPKNICRM